MKLRKKMTAILLTAIFMISAFTLAVSADLNAVGGGTAEWSSDEYHSESRSAKLYVVNGGTDWAEISIPVDIAIESFTALSFYEYIDDYDPNGFTVQVILGIDADGDDDFEADLAAWHQGPDSHTATPLKGDTFIEFEFAGGEGPTKDTWTERDALNDFSVWLPKADGTSGGMGYYGPYSGFLALLEGTSDDSAIDAGMRVKEVILQIGGSGSWMAETAYVDDVTINGVTYDLEPPLAKSKADVLKDKGVPGKGIDKAPGLTKPIPNDNFSKGSESENGLGPQSGPKGHAYGYRKGNGGE